MPTPFPPVELWTSFPTKLDTSAIGIVLDVIAKKPVDKEAAAMAVFNVAGFATGKVVSGGSPFPVMASAHDEAAVGVMLAEAHATGDMSKIPWASLLSILLKLLPFVLA